MIFKHFFTVQSEIKNTNTNTHRKKKQYRKKKCLIKDHNFNYMHTNLIKGGGGGNRRNVFWPFSIKGF